MEQKKKIKTVWRNIHGAEEFDAEVNSAIDEGWKLLTRTLIVQRTETGYPLLYAELEKIIWEETT